jgi:hypothetical protein
MRTRVVLAALAIALVGCGDDDDSGGGDVSEEEQPYVDAFVEDAADADEEDLQISPEQAECFGARFVSIVGVDRLEEAGVTPEEFGGESDLDFSTLGLSEDEGGEIYDAFADCDVDIRAELLRSMGADDMAEEDRECMADAFDDDLLRRMMITTFVEGEEALDADDELRGELFAVFAECPGAIPD